MPRDENANPKVLLTPRQVEVLNLVACGCTYQGVADVLGLSRHSIKSHLRHIYDRLGARNHAEAVVLAHRLGYIDLGRSDDAKVRRAILAARQLNGDQADVLARHVYAAIPSSGLTAVDYLWLETAIKVLAQVADLRLAEEVPGSSSMETELVVR